MPRSKLRFHSFLWKILKMQIVAEETCPNGAVYFSQPASHPFHQSRCRDRAYYCTETPNYWHSVHCRTVLYITRQESAEFWGHCTLKGHCREIFCFVFFSRIIFSQAPESNIWVNLNSNAPPLSTTPLANTISDFWHLNVNSKKNFFFMLTLVPESAYLKLFWLKLFSICYRCYLKLKIPRVFKKIWNDPNGKLRRLEETDSWKKTLRQKSRGPAYLNNGSSFTKHWKLLNVIQCHKNDNSLTLFARYLITVSELVL